MELAAPVFQALVGAAVATLLWTAIAGGSWSLRPMLAMCAAFTLILLLAFTGPWVIG